MAPLLKRGNMDKIFRTGLCTIVILGILVTSACIPIIQAQPIPTARANNTNSFETQNDNANITPPESSNEQITETESPNIEENNISNPYVFTSNGKEIDFSIGHVEITFDEGLLAGESTSFDVVSPINLGKFTTTSEALSLNSKTGVIRSEKYGNLLLGIHSGYALPERPLEAEFLRHSLERWGEGTEYVEKKIYEIIGSKGTITFNGNEFLIEVIGAIRLQKEESEGINLFPENVLDIATKMNNDGQYIALGNVEPFEKAKFGHELMINFCGRGPNNQPTYYRYIILIDIEEKLTPDE